MRRNTTRAKRRTNDSSFRDQAVQLPGDAGSGQTAAEAVRQEWRVGRQGVLDDPAAKLKLRGTPERHQAILAAFSVKMDMAKVRLRDVPYPRLNELRDSCTRVVEQEKEEAISLPRPRFLRAGQNRLDFAASEEPEKRSRGS